MQLSEDYVWQANRYWITDRPGPYESVGWNAVFLPHRVIKITPKWIIATHITTRKRIFLNRAVLEKSGEMYHSTYHEYFYLNRPEYKQRARERKTYPHPAFTDLPESYRVLGLRSNCTARELK